MASITCFALSATDKKSVKNQAKNQVNNNNSVFGVL
jgi:hypothetical protein